MTNDLRDRVAAAMWKSRGNGEWSDATNTALISIYQNLADAAIAEIQAENQELRLQCLAHEGQAQEAYAAQQRAKAKLAKAVAALEIISTHRRHCHDYDQDNGHELRAFDVEDVRLLELQARATLTDLKGGAE